MFERELSQLRRDHLLRTPVRIESALGPRVTINGRTVLLMCSNDYLGLAGHPALKDAACDAMEQYGFGSGASRLVSGNMSLHEELERRISAFKGTESAVLFNSGYAANTGIIPALAEEGDVILSDSLNHASIVDGCRLSRANVLVYRHGDADHVEKLLKAQGAARRKLIVTDGVFSMDGDLAPLPELAHLAGKYHAALMVDDAHATGVFGKNGRGTAEHFGLEGSVHIQMGTLGKALGSFGAYAAGDRDVITCLVNKSRSYMFSTSLPPALCAASLAALDVVAAEPWRRERLWENRRRFVEGLGTLGIGTGKSGSPIIPIHFGHPEKALEAGKRIFDAGLFAPAIRPPAVPAGTARIRATVMATHTQSDIDRALEIFGRLRNDGLL